MHAVEGSSRYPPGDTSRCTPQGLRVLNDLKRIVRTKIAFGP